MRKVVYTRCTDNELLQFLLRADQRAYDTIYERYARQLYAHALKKLGDREEAKDMLQDVFAALWKNRHALTPDTPLAGYLYATMRHRIIKHISHERVVRVYLDSLPALPSVDQAAADYGIREQQLRQQIEIELDRLPEKMQEVFRMSRQSLLSHREIANILGLSEATVKKHVNNALKVLRTKLASFLSLVPFFLI